MKHLSFLKQNTYFPDGQSQTIERFNNVPQTQAVPLETIDKKFRLFMVSNVDDGGGATVVSSLQLGDNTLGRMYLQPKFTNVFKPSDILKITNDRLGYGLTIVKIVDDHPKNLQLEFVEDR